MMMGFGFLIMLVVLGVPILLVAGLILLMVKPLIGQKNAPASGGPAAAPVPTALDSGTSVCSHCGAKLLAEWAHCPQCGAPTGA